ncbi:MAG: nitrophenyl compound nitroreductase subunit ArsF family protein [Candidatus ainarchaeum sp.]|nr:nitrophenyl compound nitroreductase subunit ArsF family protein [Candidatus ainarchaeum sp.]
MRMLALLVAAVLVTGCLNEAPPVANYTNNTPPPLQNLSNSTPFKYSKLQTDIIFVTFHHTDECTECLKIGNYTNNTLHEYYPGELASGKISYYDVNLDVEKDNEFVKRYNVYYQTFYMIVRNPDGETGKELAAVWNYEGDEQAFENYLMGQINGVWG